MRQLLLVAFCALFCVGTMKAQTVVHSEDFNGCSQPTGWTTNIVAGNNGWNFSIGSPGNAGNIDGTCMAWFDDDDIGSAASPSTVEVLSPVYDLTALTSAFVRFDYNFRALGNSFFLVEVYDKTTQTWVAILNEAANNCGTWTCSPKPSVNADITNYISDSVQVRFTYNDGATWAWYVGFDNFQIVYFQADDIGVTDITSPQSGCFLGANEPVVAEITNFGTNAADTIDLTLTVNGTLIATEQWIPTTPIASFASVPYTFNALGNFGANGTYDIQVTATLPTNDASITNDTFVTQVTKTALSTYPYVENFDLWNQCISCVDGACLTSAATAGWENVLGDNDDWDTRSGATTSFNTGPSSDHTGGGSYMYTETSGCNNNNVSINTPCFDFSGVVPRITFWYHMFGGTMGTMSFEADTTGTGQWVTLWSLSGDQGNEWKQVELELFSFYNKQATFRFRGATGTSFTSDMAFDDFMIEKLPDNDATPVALAAPLSSDCSFLSANESVQVAFQNTGANVLDSVVVSYSLNGTTIEMDTIVTSLLPGAIDTHTFATPANLAATGFYDFDVTASAFSTDDLPSNDMLSVEVANEGIIQTFPATQNFDGFDICDAACSNDFCDTAFTALGWHNITNDNFDWNVADGVLFNANGATGPSADHTSGSGKFLVINSNFCGGPSNAIVETPCYDLSVTTNPQVDFWYHMFGATMGTMRLQIDSSGQGNYNTIFTLAANQGNSWQKAEVNLSAYVNKVVRFRIIGSLPIGIGSASNMAVDDFTVRDLFAFDGAPVAITEPADTNCSLTATETVTVEVENVGADTLSNPSMTLIVDGLLVATESWTTTLVPNEIKSYTFTATADLSAPTQHSVKVVTGFSNDQEVSNDTLERMVGRAPIASYPYVQTFDAFNICASSCQDGTCTGAFTADGWLNLVGYGDGEDWNVGTGSTPTFGTGPTVDHTTGTTGNYVFAEANGCVNQQQTFQTPCFDLAPLTNPNVIFWYHMFGGDQGTLTLEVDAGNGFAPIWTKSGDQGNQWLPANISLSAYSGQVVRFRMVGVSGAGVQSDFAIDDFAVQEAPAFDVQPVVFATPITNGCVNYTANEQVIVNILNSGAAAASNVTAILKLNGVTVVTDNIAGPIPAGATISHTFSQTIDLSAPGIFTIEADVTVANDAFTVNDVLNVTGENDGAGIVAAFPYSVDFDSWGLCTSNCNNNNACLAPGVVSTAGWRNVTLGDDANWGVNNLATPSFNTGPSGDHTGGGNYFYMETSGACNGQVFIMQAPCFDFTNLYGPEVRFWYHMFGAAMGTLEFQVNSSSNSNWTTVWSESGNQGDQWLEAVVDLSAYAGTVTKMRFRGTAGTSFTSDMAVDDFGIRDIVPNDLQVTSLNDLQNGCGDDSLYMTVSVYNAGQATENDYSLTAEMTGANTGSVTLNFTAPFPSETSQNFFIGPFNTSNGGTHDFKVYTTINNNTDFVASNDTLSQSIISTQLSNVVGMDTTSCGPAAFPLSVSGDATAYYWYYGPFGGNFFNVDSTYNTPTLSDSVTYWVEGRNPFFASVGKVDSSSNGGDGGYYDFFEDGLSFDADFDLTIERVTVYPQLAGGATNATIQINLRDANGALLDSVATQYWGTAGDTTIELNFDVPTGTDYTLDAEGTSVYDVRLYRNGFGGASYPFVEPGAMSITSAKNNLNSFYYFFYDIQIQYLGCPSPRIAVNANIAPNDIAVSDSTAVVSDPATGTGSATIFVSGGTEPYSYEWNTNPVQTDTTATGLLPGSYIVTITDAGGCTALGSVTVGTVNTNEVVGLQKFNIFPNPTSGLFTVDVELDASHDVQLEIFNTMGQMVYTTSEENTTARQYAVDFTNFAAGVYQVRIRVDNQYVTRRVIVSGM